SEEQPQPWVDDAPEVAVHPAIAPGKERPEAVGIGRVHQEMTADADRGGGEQGQGTGPRRGPGPPGETPSIDPQQGGPQKNGEDREAEQRVRPAAMVVVIDQGAPEAAPGEIDVGQV